MSKPLMPKATAVWLLDNTTLTFDQIAAFCALHPLEIQAIADGDVAMGIVGRDPVVQGILTAADITTCEANATLRLTFVSSDVPDVQRRAMALATLLEPLLIVGMGVVVMVIVLAVLQPIIQLQSFVK